MENYQYYENQTFEEYESKVVEGCNFTICSFLNAEEITFERCNFEKCDFKSITSFDKSNLLDCTFVDGSNFTLSNVDTSKEKDEGVE